MAKKKSLFDSIFGTQKQRDKAFVEAYPFMKGAVNSRNKGRKVMAETYPTTISGMLKKQKKRSSKKNMFGL